MIIVGINAYHPDASVALLKDGELLWAAEEERFSRIKHASGFPKLALRRCLEETQIPPSAIDTVAISKNPRANFLRKTFFVLRNKPQTAFVMNRVKAFCRSSKFERDFAEALNVVPSCLKARFVHVEHHQCHVASSFFYSGFKSAAFLTLDGLGDFSSAMWGIADRHEIRVMDRIFFPHSAGFLYTAGTQFLGFDKFGDEYKVMGLAAYGKPTYLEELRRLVRFCPRGRFELVLDYFTHHRGQSKIRWEGGAPEQDLLFSEKWADVFGPPHPPGKPLSERERNIAASLQIVLEEIYWHILNPLYEATQEENLCLAGGVAYNGVANGRITKMTPFKNVYIQPAAGDAGTALGAAAYVYHYAYKYPAKFKINHASYGSKAMDGQIETALKSKGLAFERLPRERLLQRTAKDIAEGKIVGWFQGRMEFGPRALGNRSILADPRRKDMKDILNARIKNREAFRPFAPAVLVEKAKEYFEIDCDEAPFMIRVFPVKKGKETVIPAVTHLDGTARVQTVSRDGNLLFWQLLSAFEKETGVPVLLNTSFNEHEPIVCQPEEAVDCYLKTKMDVLVLKDFYLAK